MIKDVSTNGTLLNNIRLTKNQGYIFTTAMGSATRLWCQRRRYEIYCFSSASHDASKYFGQGMHAHYDLRSGHRGVVVGAYCQRSTGNHYAVKVIDKKKVMHGMAVQREVEILQDDSA